MKAALLLALRATTGLLLVIWGFIKVGSPDSAIGVSNRYYGGMISADMLQTPLGAAQIALGVAVILGLFRAVTYPLQALILVGGALVIWQYLLDPLALWLVDEESRRTLFFPSTTVAVATLIMLAFKSDDTLTLDRLIFKR